MLWRGVLGAALPSEDGGAEAHRAVGVKLVDLVAFEEEETTNWVGIGLIAERPIGHRGVVEVSVQGLAGSPGFSVPIDLLLKRVWSRGRLIVTAGGGPALTLLRRDEETSIFPGALASLGGSWWFGQEESWGLLAEIDAGGSVESGGLVPEIEFAVGALLKF
ncbi:MAG: hypothetical protein AAF602_18195 [Myxococcota bacterium]